MLLFANATTFRTNDTEAVRIIDHKPCGLRLSELGERSHGRDVAVHAENTVGCDNGSGFGVFASELSQRGSGRLSIIVRIALEFAGTGEQCRVDQRGVIQTILQDEIVALSECGDDTEIRHIAGGEHDRSFAAREIGERAFKRIVLGIVPTDEM